MARVRFIANNNVWATGIRHERYSNFMATGVRVDSKLRNRRRQARVGLLASGKVDRCPTIEYSQ